ncbi:uncharacterized protein TNCV_4917601 [Trichonephila clavipes]|nr:uncharacterized protein TNCV_4917601 [Trichonephila clavipes]
MDVSNCMVPSRNRSPLNSRRAVSPLVSLVEGEERWEGPGPSLGQNWGETKLNRPVICMVLKATANDIRHLVLCLDEYVGLDLR